eukprot:15326594-Ditylum_brightwellii.AAC.2
MATKMQQHNQTSWVAARHTRIGEYSPSLDSIPNHKTAFIDSGASGHYLQPDAPAQEISTKASQLAVGQPGKA